MTQVLIIESDADFAQHLQDELQAGQCDVTVIADGKDAIAHASGAPPDLIIVTAELPKMNGFTVCNRLRKEPGLRDTPIVLLSEDASEETFSQHSKMEGKRANAYLHKPLRFDDLAPTLGQFIPLATSAPLSRAPVSSGLPPSIYPSPDSLVADVGDGAPPSAFGSELTEAGHSNALNLAAQAALEEITAAEDVEELDLRELEDVAPNNRPMGRLNDRTEVSAVGDLAAREAENRTAGGGPIASLNAALEAEERSHQAQLEQVTRASEEQRKSHEADLEALANEMSALRAEHAGEVERLKAELAQARQPASVSEAESALAELQEEHSSLIARHTQLLDALRAENAATVSRLEAEQAAALHTLNVEQQKRLQAKDREHEEALRAATDAHAAELRAEREANSSAMQAARESHAASMTQLEETLQTAQQGFADEKASLEALLARERSSHADAAASAARELEQTRRGFEQEKAALEERLRSASEKLATLEEQIDHSQSQVSTLLEQRDQDRASLRDLKQTLGHAISQVDMVFARDGQPERL